MENKKNTINYLLNKVEEKKKHSQQKQIFLTFSTVP